MSKLVIFLAQLAIVNLLFMLYKTGSAEEKPINLTASGMPHVVEHYNVQDQCHPLPGHLLMHFHRLVMHLDGDKQFCEGQGLLICFPGQLDGTRPVHGPIRAATVHQLPNIKGNKVAIRCGKLREDKCGDKCKDQPAFHGLLLKTNRARDVTIQLSTSKRTFIVHKEQFKKWLVCKLTSARSPILESFLSRTFGPMRDFSSQKKDGKEREEAQERIHVARDDNMRKAFARNSFAGTSLRNYVGIWSLGWDLLPTGMDNQMMFLTERDEQCCEMEAFYLSPTVNSIPKTFVNVNVTKDLSNATFYYTTLLANGNGAVIRGRVKDNAKFISFQMENLLMLDPELANQVRIKVVRQTVDFDRNVGTFRLFYSNNSKTVTKTRVLFVRGKHFHLELLFKANELEINLDCPGNNDGAEPLPGFASFEDLYRITIDGDLELFRDIPVFTNATGAWYFPKGIVEKHGILLRGLVLEKPENSVKDVFRIKLWGEKEGIFVLALHFVVDFKAQNFSISHSDETGMKLHEEKVNFATAFPGDGNPIYNGTKLEVYIYLQDGKTFAIWLNDTLVKEYRNEEMTGKIKYAQAIGDVEINQMDETDKFPIGGDVQNFADKDFAISGRVLSLKKDIKLDFIHDTQSILSIRCSRTETLVSDGTFVTAVNATKLLSPLEHQSDFQIKISLEANRHAIGGQEFTVKINKQSVTIPFRIDMIADNYVMTGDVLLYKQTVWHIRH